MKPNLCYSNNVTEWLRPSIFPLLPWAQRVSRRDSGQLYIWICPLRCSISIPLSRLWSMWTKQSRLIPNTRNLTTEDSNFSNSCKCRKLLFWMELYPRGFVTRKSLPSKNRFWTDGEPMQGCNNCKNNYKTKASFRNTLESDWNSISNKFTLDLSKGIHFAIKNQCRVRAKQGQTQTIGPLTVEQTRRIYSLALPVYFFSTFRIYPG